jgi:uncharacterized lipoprotein
MMISLRAFAVLTASMLLGACSGDTELRCASGVSYREARSAATLRIPDDLSLPDESESFRIPGPTPASAESEETATSSLEESPAFTEPAQP